MTVRQRWCAFRGHGERVRLSSEGWWGPPFLAIAFREDPNGDMLGCRRCGFVFVGERPSDTEEEA